jgi:hypothetical protein
VLIDGAVEVPLNGAMEEEDLVNVPAGAKPTTMPPGRGCELWTEGLGPGEHSPGRDINATLIRRQKAEGIVNEESAALVDLYWKTQRYPEPVRSATEESIRE